MGNSFLENIKKDGVPTTDVLSCLANLSNDEVFTPPVIVNQMLDMLPQELFSDPTARFLDPACKTGVFLREIAKRLIIGLEPIYPDLQERIDHIFHEQLFGIAITELTSLISRRSLYCSKYPNGPYSITHFDDPEGNIRFKRVKHVWNNSGKCIYCGVDKQAWDRGDNKETYAYEFIHNINLREDFNMGFFDVIISNPPYQMSFQLSGNNSANAKSIYNLFIDQAIKLSPNYIVMITPSRWMTKTAQGIPETWTENLLKTNSIKIMHDFEDASQCFPGVEIKGGVNYFMIDKNFTGPCEYYFHQNDGEIVKKNDYLEYKESGIVIRNPKAYSILDKIIKIEGEYFKENNFSSLVSPKHFFDDSKLLTSNWHDYQSVKDSTYNIKYYLNLNRERTHRWISNVQLPKNHRTKDIYKVFIPAAGGSGTDDLILGKPFIGEPNSVCSQTFLVIGYDPDKHNYTEQQCINIVKYIKTKFFRYLVSIKKKTQNGPRGVYQFVPLQNFNEEWNDQKLYSKYDLSSEEIENIESTIREFPLTED